MRIILARLRSEYARGERDRVCHVLPVLDNPAPEKLEAFCGAVFAPGETEALGRPTGMPCGQCLALASLERDVLPEAPPPSPRHQLAAHPTGRAPRPGSPRPRSRTWAGQPAVGLRDAHLVHRVPDNPVISTLDDSPVVLAVCGVLAHPVTTEPPVDWPHCAQCAADPAWPSENREPAARNTASTSGAAGRAVEVVDRYRHGWLTGRRPA